MATMRKRGALLALALTGALAAPVLITPGAARAALPADTTTTPTSSTPTASATAVATSTPTSSPSATLTATATASATAATPTGTAPPTTTLAASTGTASVSPSAGPVVTATLAVSPTTTNRGGVVTVSGTGFAPNETVSLAIAGAPRAATTAKADGQGTLPATGLSIPYSLRLGAHTVMATGATSGRTASAGIVVQSLTPSITLSAGTVRPGDRVTVTGAGFGRQEQVTLALNGAALSTTPTFIATANGSFTATFTAPGRLLAGSNTVSAVGNRSRVTAVATLNGALTLANRFYFAGGTNTTTEQAFVQLLNTNGQPASVRLTFYLASGATYTRPVTANPHAQTGVAVASLGLPQGSFGLAVESDRAIGAQINSIRNGRDGDALLGNTGLGQTWYLAEGYTGLSFRETVSILNPDQTTPAHVQLQILPLGGGAGKSVPVTVPAHSNGVVDINAQFPGKSVSIVAMSDRPVVVERTLTFSSNGYGQTTRAGTNSASANWLFAEGTTVNRFETYLTILNPSVQPASVTASFFGASGNTLGSRTVLVAARSRANIKLNDTLNASGIASVVTSNQLIVVERPEYFGSPNGANVAGSDVFGRNGAGVRWSFPGGNTQGNSEFLLLYNPSGVTVPVDATFYGSDGQTATRRVYVAPTARYNIDVNRLLPGFAPIHGAVVRSANGQGFVAEQTVFAPDHTTLRSTEGLAQ